MTTYRYIILNMLTAAVNKKQISEIALARLDTYCKTNGLDKTDKKEVSHNDNFGDSESGKVAVRWTGGVWDT